MNKSLILTLFGAMALAGCHVYGADPFRDHQRNIALFRQDLYSPNAPSTLYFENRIKQLGLVHEVNMLLGHAAVAGNVEALYALKNLGARITIAYQGCTPMERAHAMINDPKASESTKAKCRLFVKELEKLGVPSLHTNNAPVYQSSNNSSNNSINAQTSFSDQINPNVFSFYKLLNTGLDTKRYAEIIREDFDRNDKKSLGLLLARAAEVGDLYAVKALITLDAPVNDSIRIAQINGHHTIANYIKQCGLFSSFINLINKDSDNLEAFAELVKIGLSLNGFDSGKLSPLAVAINMENLALIKLLVEAGASVQEVDIKDNCSALDRALKKDNQEIINYLSDAAEKENAIKQAKTLLLTLARADENSLVSNDYLPLDLFKYIMSKAKLFYKFSYNDKN